MLRCEWGVFEDLAAHHPHLLSRVGQLAIELHAYHPIPGIRSAEPLAVAPAGDAAAVAAAVAAAADSTGVPAPFTAARLRKFAAHVMGEHGFTVAHRHLNLASLLKDHRYHRIVGDDIDAEWPRPEAWGGSRQAAAGGKQPMLWAYWELLMHRKEAV